MHLPNAFLLYFIIYLENLHVHLFVVIFVDGGNISAERSIHRPLARCFFPVERPLESTNCHRLAASHKALPMWWPRSNGVRTKRKKWNQEGSISRLEGVRDHTCSMWKVEMENSRLLDRSMLGEGGGGYIATTIYACLFLYLTRKKRSTDVHRCRDFAGSY
jgi:hypothetical protein